MAAHLEANPARARGGQFHAGADRAARGTGRARQRAPGRRRRRCPIRCWRCWPDAPLPPEPARATGAAAGLPARAIATHLIDRYPAYAELADLAETFDAPERIAYASDQYLRDLAVWYHLAWLGETVQAQRCARRGAARARRATSMPAHRRLLLELIGELLAGVLPRYRALAERGQVRAGGVALRASDPAAADRFRLGARIDARMRRCRTPRAIRAARERAAWHMQRSAARVPSASSAASRAAAGRRKARSATRALELHRGARLALGRERRQRAARLPGARPPVGPAPRRPNCAPGRSPGSALQLLLPAR